MNASAPRFTLDPSVTALALGSAASFGLSLVLTQVGLRHLEGFRAGSAVLFALAGCLFPAAVTLLMFEANLRVGPAIAGALGNLTPLFAVLIAFLLLGEVPRLGQLAGIVVILAGVLLIIGAPRNSPHQAFGWAVVLLLLAACIRGLVQPVVKLGLESWPSPFAATLIGYLISALVVLSVGARRAISPFRTNGWRWFAPIGLLNGLAVLTLYAALARGPVAVVAPLVACYPLATLAFNRLLLGTGGLTWNAGVGVAITVAGVALLLRA